ncbi:MAG: hypothetical protein AAF737_04125 [Pseudomonadota bacterium]
MSESNDFLLLKWGTVKGWSIRDEAVLKLLQEFMQGACISAAMDKPDEARREKLCAVIDAFDGEISSDWTGEAFTKEQAKAYVREYGITQ